MKKLTAYSLVLAVLLGGPLVGFAQDKKDVKPYPLDKCIVTDEKLDSMGKPYVFTHDGQEIKMCCKSCLKDFNKDKAKYLKKLESASKPDKK